MKKWICKVCGYTHKGDEAPKSCPTCGAPKSDFYFDYEESNGCKLPFIVSIITTLTLTTILFFTCCPTPKVDNSAVETVDIYRYLGKWYEIARFNHRFERDMHQCIATYTMEKNGNIKVSNIGFKDGKWKSTEGKAKLTDEPGVLRVSFWGPFYSDYRILMLAPDYSYALVGGDDEDYLWILSRTPSLNDSTIDHLVNEASKRGYDTSKLIWVRQSK